MMRIMKYAFASLIPVLCLGMSFVESSGPVAESGMYDLSILKDTLYVAMGDPGIMVMDCADPLDMHRLNVQTLHCSVKQIEARGHHAYITTGEPGFMILDISDPSNLKVVYSQTEGLDDVMGMHIENDVLFLAAESGSLFVFDITDPDNAKIIDRLECELLTSSVNIFVEGSILWITSNETIRMVDISDPSDIKLIYQDKKSWDHIAVSDKYLVTADENRLLIHRHHETATPWKVSEVAFDNDVKSVNLFGNYAVFSVEDVNGLQFLPLKAPDSGTRWTLSPDSKIEDTGFFRDALWYMTKKETCLVSINQNGVPVQKWHFPYQVYLHELKDGKIIGSSPLTHLMVFNPEISGPESLEICYPVFGYPQVLLADGKRLYVGGGRGCAGYLHSFDIKNPRKLRPIRFTTVPGQPVTDIHAKGNTLFVACRDSLVILKWKRGKQPKEIGSYDSLMDDIDYISIAGDYCYAVSDAEQGLTVFDIHDLTNPVELEQDRKKEEYEAGDILAHKGFLYVTAGKFLKTYSLAEPVKPRIISTLELSSTGGRIYRSGRHLFVTLAGKGFSVINISSPDKPKIISTTSTPGMAMDILAMKGRAYVADGWKGLQVYNISNPENPVLEHSLNIGRVIAVEAQGRFLYCIRKTHENQENDQKALIQALRDHSYKADLFIMDISASDARPKIISRKDLSYLN